MKISVQKEIKSPYDKIQNLSMEMTKPPDKEIKNHQSIKTKTTVLVVCTGPVLLEHNGPVPFERYGPSGGPF
jgi:hypothetical protein